MEFFLDTADIEQIRTLYLQMCVRAESMVRRAVRSVTGGLPLLK